MKNYLKLMRPKHWLKNALVFAALIFSGRLFELNSLISVLLGMGAFCCITSVIYIINDIYDIEEDRRHDIKRHRPLASGAVSVKNAIVLMCCCFLVAIGISTLNFTGFLPPLLLLVYLLLNVGYSLILKHIPLIDVFILMSGFLLRILYGAQIIGQPVSHWLYLTVMSMAFYIALGKRRNEFARFSHIKGDNVRMVLKYYNLNFLGKNMYVCLTLTIVFYALWAVDSVTAMVHFNSAFLTWSVPIIIFICMRYDLISETAALADPVDVLLGDKVLISAVLLYGVFMASGMYGRALLGRG